MDVLCTTYRASGVRSVARLGAAILCVSLAGCDAPSPTEPGPPQSIVQGTWVGLVADRIRGEGRLRLSVAGFEQSAQGRFTMTFDDSSHDLSGEVTISTIDQPRIEIFFRVPGAAGCPAGGGLVLHGRGTIAAADRLSGNYMDLVACGSARNGTWELSRP